MQSTFPHKKSVTYGTTNLFLKNSFASSPTSFLPDRPFLIADGLNNK